MKDNEENKQTTQQKPDDVTINISFKKSNLSAALFLMVGLGLMFLITSSTAVHTFIITVLVLGLCALILPSFFSKSDKKEEQEKSAVNKVEGVVTQTPQPVQQAEGSTVKTRPKPMMEQQQEIQQEPAQVPVTESTTMTEPQLAQMEADFSALDSFFSVDSESTESSSEEFSDDEWKKFFSGL